MGTTFKKVIGKPMGVDAMMSSQRKTSVTSLTLMKTVAGFVVVPAILIASASVAQADWSIDLSRRTQQMRKQEMNPNYGREPAAVRTFEGDEPPVEASNEPVARPHLDGSVDAPVQRSAPTTSFVDRLFDPGQPSQDIVILNTERGFVPNTIRVRKDARYTVHVVNVNEKEKNVSFILDGFSEHHATFFGKVRAFRLEPKKEGVYSFLSPETSAEGRFIVVTDGSPVVRGPTAALGDQ